ncbi:MAG: Rne/Rng family ribonuclease [Deltaproteobacteria bacterium]|nr:Rne/Rng family ribonuclease [Deltaproteobacteria bacterium]
MAKNILINAVDPEEVRIAIVDQNKLEGFHIETAAREITRGNIYKGVIARVEPSLQAAFVDYGADRHGFLQKQEIHPDYYLETSSGGTSVSEVLKPGQELLVQVTKDPVMKKGAMLTTYISLPGRFLVLMPGSKNRGVSRQVEDEKERDRLKKLIDSASLPENFGVILRTAAEGCTKTALNKDLQNLMRLWKDIRKRGLEKKAPVLLYKDRSLAIRVIRDYFTTDVSTILVDDPTVHAEIKEFMGIISPRRIKSVKIYKDPKPIFTKYQLEEQISSIFNSRVGLKSGGSVVINPTEALVSVDVNSGKATKEASVEKTAYQTNLEAAEEVARQLRLRDLGGLIVVDFIDMRDAKHRAAVEKAMREHTKKDKARVKVGKISQFGLLEMSRQRINPSIEFGSYVECPHCHGKGMVPSVETLGLSFLRKLRIETLKQNAAVVEGVLPVNVAEYLSNKKRKELADLETRRDVSIVIRGDAALKPGESRIHTENKT